MFDQSKTFIICEFSQTHEGSLSLAKMLINAASEAQADAVKVQVFTADELAVPDYKHYDLFKRLEWPEASWKELIEYGHSCGLKVYADVFGCDSVSMLTRNGIDGFKIHGTDIRNTRLLNSLSELKLPILLSIGGGTIEETKEAISVLNSHGVGRLIVLMHGFQSYPTLVEHTNLKKMLYFREVLRMPVGYADHIDGDDPLNFALCAAAIGMGASVIEKHITISRTLKMEDYESALSPEEFVRFVQRVRALDSANGEYSEDMLQVELDYRQATRKHVVAARPIMKGDMIRDSDVTLRRAEGDVNPSDVDEVIGKAADRRYEVNDIICAMELVSTRVM